MSCELTECDISLTYNERKHYQQKLSVERLAIATVSDRAEPEALSTNTLMYSFLHEDAIHIMLSFLCLLLFVENNQNWLCIHMRTEYIGHIS